MGKLAMQTESSYETRLGDALEKLLEEGADDLQALSSGLNALGVLSAEGNAWTPDSLAAEFRRLGA